VWRHVENVPFFGFFSPSARWKRAATGLLG
jgi:hypothetical protein